MSKFKTIYEFEVVKKEKVEETVESVDDAGATIKVTKTVDKDVTKRFCLKKPTLSQRDDAELFYHSTLGQSIQKGLIPEAVLHKIIGNQGGVLTEEQNSKRQADLQSLIDKNMELAKLNGVDSAEYQKEIEVLRKEILELTGQLQKYAFDESSVFNITAENRAKSKTIMWWMVTLLHRYEDDQWLEMFPGTGYKEKYDAFASIEDKDDWEPGEKQFLGEVIAKASFATAFWVSRGFIDKEELESLQKEEFAV